MKRLTALLLAAALALSLAACGPEGKALRPIQCLGRSDALQQPLGEQLLPHHLRQDLRPPGLCPCRRHPGAPRGVLLGERRRRDGRPVSPGRACRLPRRHSGDGEALGGYHCPPDRPGLPHPGAVGLCGALRHRRHRRGGAGGGPGSGGGGQVHPEAHLQDPHHAGGLPAGQEPGVLRSAHPSAGGDSAGGRDGAGAVGRACWLRPLQIRLRDAGEPAGAGGQPGLPTGPPWL